MKTEAVLMQTLLTWTKVCKNKTNLEGGDRFELVITIKYCLIFLTLLFNQKKLIAFADGEILYGRRDIDEPMRDYHQPLIQAESVRTKMT